MRYAGIIKDDFVNGEDVCVSFWTQGCPHRCPGCHNAQTWDFKGGLEKPVSEVISEILTDIKSNGVIRNFSILGGEPLCNENKEYVALIVREVRAAYPDIKIYLWTGYTDEELANDRTDGFTKYILSECEVYVTGRYIAAQRDITQKWYGSTNQIVHSKH